MALRWLASLLLCTGASAEEVLEKVQIRILDVSGGTISGAKVSLACKGATPTFEAYSDAEGLVTFSMSPPVGCTVTARADKFQPHTQYLEIRRELAPIEIGLSPMQSKTEIVVAAGPGAIETTQTIAAATLTREHLDRVPMFNRATGFTDILTRTTPGVAADSNGFAHPLGEHADTSISLDGQPITDQQAKVFANQINPDIIDSLTAITGAPPADFGGKTSLVVTVTTKSGLGARSSGFLQSELGNFGTWNESAGWSKGGRNWGNFLAITGTKSNRFLDSPEFLPIHDRGNSGALFDRI